MGSTSRISPEQWNDSIVHKVVTAVAEYEQCEPRELPPLATAVDPDVLDRVVHGPGVSEVSFSYHGYWIEIDSDGDLRVTPEEVR